MFVVFQPTSWNADSNLFLELKLDFRAIYIKVTKEGGSYVYLKMNQDWVSLLQLKEYTNTPIYVEFRGVDGDWEITYMERSDGIITKHCSTCTCF